MITVGLWGCNSINFSPNVTVTGVCVGSGCVPVGFVRKVWIRLIVLCKRVVRIVREDGV